ncbi:MAG: hypothetical protein MZV63_28190 [Marinilabiliales bacterium]|nr:hypothetical protein [Marinilabiliales bacterium]
MRQASLSGSTADQDREWIRADLYLEKGVRPEQLDLEIIKLLKDLRWHSLKSTCC